MNKSEHTPGPWTANLHHTQDYGGRAHAFIHAAKPLVPLAAVVLAAERCDQAEGRANARLIAAAPDLLETLSVTLAMAEDYLNDTSQDRDHFLTALDGARAAIAKATGNLTVSGDQ